MSTLNNVELPIITIVLGIFFLLGCVVAIYFIKLLRATNRLYKKAESFIGSAQSAAETIQRLGLGTRQKFPLIRLLNHILDNGPKSREK